MIPWLAVVSISPENGRRVNLWLPLILFWILLAPFVVLLIPMGMVCFAICGMNPLKAILAIGRLLWALGGLRIEVESPNASVLIRMH
jgi:hypothetical protein